MSGAQLEANLETVRPAVIDGVQGTTVIREMTAARRMVLDGWSGTLQDLEIRDLEGRDISEEVQPSLTAGRLTMTAAPLEPFIARRAGITQLGIDAGRRVVLPGGVVIPGAGSSPDRPESPAWLRLFLEASPVPARWNEELRNYVTRLTFGLQRPPGVSESITLKKPVIVKLAFEGFTGEEVEPIFLFAPGLEHEKTVELRFRPLTAQSRLLVRSSLSDVDFELRALPRLELRPVQNSMLGLGLAQVDVMVEHVLPHGERFPAGRPTVVALQVEGTARPEPSGLTLGVGQATGSFVLRSSGLGPVRVVATADGVIGAASVYQAFPFGPLAAALLGGAIGGYARRFVRGARRSLAGRRVVEGTVVGLIAFVAGVLGVGFFGVSPVLVATEAGAFLVAALCGFVGVNMLEKLTQDKKAA